MKVKVKNKKTGEVVEVDKPSAEVLIKSGLFETVKDTGKKQV